MALSFTKSGYGDLCERSQACGPVSYLSTAGADGVSLPGRVAGSGTGTIGVSARAGGAASFDEALLGFSTRLAAPLLRRFYAAIAALMGTPSLGSLVFVVSFAGGADGRHERRHRVAGGKGFLQRFIQGVALLSLAVGAFLRCFVVRWRGMPVVGKILAVAIGHGESG
jgi:hypothetical protein